MKKIKSLLILSTFVISFVILFEASCVSFADNNECDSKDLECLQDLADSLQKKIDQINGKQSSLSNEIDYLNTQISLAEVQIRNSNAKINATESAIQNLSSDIGDLASRIDKLGITIDHQLQVLALRMRERYKSREESVVMLIGTDHLSRLVQKIEYLLVMERHDNVLVTQMRQTKDTFNTQKKLFEEKRSEQESLKNKLISEKANLDAYKAGLLDKQEERKRLLEITQNDEAKYQQLLNEAQRELNQIVGAAVVLKNTKPIKVKKGQVIGTQGNSGYSFGEHLHFGVYKYKSFNDIDGWNWYYSNYVDPSKKLSSRSIYWNTGCESPKTKTVGSGDWGWPLRSAQVSQGFGVTCWSNRYYGGKPHPAYDLYGPSGSAIYAVDNGNAYSCRNCLGDGGNGMFIFHDDGYMTLYWHLR